MTCQCPLAGYCETHGREMPEPFWRLCRDKPGYFEVFQQDRYKWTDKTPEQALACVHRGEVSRKHKCKPCQNSTGSTKVDIYACALHRECTLHTVQGAKVGGKKRGKPMPSCATCQDRAETAPPHTVEFEYPKNLKRPKVIPGIFFDAYEQPADFLQNQWFDAGVFLLCGGPSLRETDLSILNQRGIVTAAVNNCAATVYRPDMWFSVDAPSQFSEVIFRDPDIMCFTKVKYLTYELWESRGGALHRTTRKVRQCPNVWGFDHCHGWEANNFLTMPKPTWGVNSKEEDPDGDGKHLSVMLPAVRLLYTLGFRRLYLVGANFKMREDNPYGFDEKVNAGRARSNNKLYNWLDRRFREAAPKMAELGFRVYNCTPGSKLTAFKALSLFEAVSRELAAMPAEVQTRGHYRA